MNTVEGRARLDAFHLKHCANCVYNVVTAITIMPSDKTFEENMKELIVRYKKLIMAALDSIPIYRVKTQLGVSHTFVLTKKELQAMKDETNLEAITNNTEKIRQSFGVTF